MKLTIAYVTARAEPCLEWMLASLATQTMPGDDIQIVVVDYFGRDWRCQIPGLTSVRASAPKPTMWQGPHRLTSKDYWAMSNARNTAIVLASHDYIAFLDDRCRLSPGWLNVVRQGERERTSVIAGPYDKMEARGLVIDHRTARAPTRQACGGSWLFGGNFCLPLAWALEVNGFEEGCDTVGGEDYIFGQMLENAGRRIEFAPKMHVQQDRTGVSGDHPFPRWDKGVSPRDKSHAMNDRFGRRKRTEFTSDLTALRTHVAAGGGWPILDPNADHRDWYDGQPVREM